MVNLANCSTSGSLTTTSSFTVNFDASTSTATFTNLIINQTGMYILKVNLNNQNIQCTLPGLIVKMATDQILTRNTISQQPDLVLTFQGNYNSYTSEQLNEFQAMIYNCLLRQNGILIQRQIQLYAGSIVASMCTSGTTQQYTSLTNSLTSSGNYSLNGLQLSNAQIQSQTYSFATGGGSGATTANAAVTTANGAVTTANGVVTTANGVVTTVSVVTIPSGSFRSLKISYFVNILIVIKIFIFNYII